jgi:hypothetical protein
MMVCPHLRRCFAYGGVPKGAVVLQVRPRDAAVREGINPGLLRFHEVAGAWVTNW